MEIFSYFGVIKNIEVDFSRRKNSAFIKYENDLQAEKAFIFMNNGYIDGNLVLMEKVRKLKESERKRR